MNRGLFLIAASLLGDLPPADLPAYRAALIPTPNAAATLVSFRDLWDRPEAWRGRPVAIRGQVVRGFSAPASGSLPARFEVWIATDVDDLVCAVYPAGSAPETPSNRRVAFSGTSLGRIGYDSGDGPRLAPLIVGPSPPGVLPNQTIATSRGFGSPIDWTLAAIAVAFLIFMMARVRRRRPAGPRLDAGPPLEFTS